MLKRDDAESGEHGLGALGPRIWIGWKRVKVSAETQILSSDGFTRYREKLLLQLE